MDIANLKSIIDKAISDYAQLGDKKKNQKLADFQNHTNTKLGELEQQLPMDRQGNLRPDNALNFVGGGLAGHLKYKVDLAEGMTKLKDKDIKELIRMILPFDRSKTPTGLTQYLNPLDPKEHYTLDFSDPLHAIIKNAYSGQSKGNGTLNKKLYAMLANEGFLNHNVYTRPDRISVMNIVEPNTKQGILNGKTDASGNLLPDELFKTLWGKTPKRLGERFGGEAQPIQMGSTDRYANLQMAIDKGINPYNPEEMRQFLNYYEPRTVYRPEDIYSGVDFTSKIKYPSPKK